MALGQGYTLRAEAQAASAEGPLPDPRDVPRPGEQSPGGCFPECPLPPHRLPASCSPCLPLRPTVLRQPHWVSCGVPCLCWITRRREQKALGVFQIHARGSHPPMWGLPCAGSPRITVKGEPRITRGEEGLDTAAPAQAPPPGGQRLPGVSLSPASAPLSQAAARSP